MTATTVDTWETCRFCLAKIQPANPDATYWIDIEGYDQCMGTEDFHAPRSICRVVDQILQWTNEDGTLNIHAGDLILDQGEMCAVEQIYVETLGDGSLWLHVDLRDPRGTETGLPVAAHEFSGAGLVAVRRYVETTA
jgi:hypothetical protein